MQKFAIIHTRRAQWALTYKAAEGRGSSLDAAFRMRRLQSKSKYLLTCAAAAAAAAAGGGGRWTDGGFFSADVKKE